MPAAADGTTVLPQLEPRLQPRIVRVAAAQFEPVPFDLEANIAKACKYITEAGHKGAKLIAFAECAIPGYPYWIWTRSIDMEMAEKYMNNCLKVDSPQFQLLCAAAKEAKVSVHLGFSEHYNRTLYIASAMIGADGEIKMTRRKIKPTHMERTIFGDGSGASLMNVVDIRGIGKVGGLNCWEHTQPLLRYHTYSQGEEIHVAAWPAMLSWESGKSPYHTAAEGKEALEQIHSVEGSCFSLYVNSILPQSTIDLQNCKEGALFNKPGGGLTQIFAPDGSPLETYVQTLKEDEEGLVIADLDLREIDRAKHYLDTHGHYSRPDLLWLGVDKREKKHVRYE
ncbi:carbon-nitrogen hydrolase [Cryphonectria parasitica EP155]|uniref:nitrilase n=1 Tax=Cryphonectria parasitica (strain ATCC 38755 / EP155) TaxID=660469 RepID=A0A9P4Y022_CRYP1|nr:carbon-nitrogen hydrolase [Cryphonectria parasitica EP155]KAF3764066.1 carbon-nitrogen hydrolase [Cryphonectria parasitica EP155]